MKVILLTEIPGRGGEGDVVDVARGFFNNYLGPRGMAVLATKGNLKQLEQRRGSIAKREETRIARANELKAALEGKTVVVPAKVGEEGVLFGSVTASMVAVKADLDLEIDRKRLVMRQAIKTAGEHVVELSIYRDIKVGINLFVGEPKVEEAPAEVEEAPAEEAPAEAAEVEETEAE